LSHGEKITNAEDNDALEDWNERASSLFEWIGMVNIGAQRYVSQYCGPLGDDYLKPCGIRLHANDRVDPYVAVYSPPAPFTVGDMVHMRWHGFLTPQFVQRIVDTATYVWVFVSFVVEAQTRAERFCLGGGRLVLASL
jgi:ribonuclease P/MRP protein subunit RPP40